MKWILIAKSADNKNLPAAKEFFKKNNLETVDFIADENKILESASDISSLFNEIALYGLFLDGENFYSDVNLAYVFGALVASHKTTFVLNESGAKSSGLTHYVDNNLNGLLALIEEKLPEYKAKEVKDCAYQDLFNKGLPFTPDCFGMAISRNKMKIASQYLAAGMSVDAIDTEGTSMLGLAVRNDQEEMVSWLLENGADVNTVSKDRGYTPVMDAVWRTNVALTKLLLEKGAKLDTISKEGQTILVLAVGIGNAEICELLLKNGADSETKDAMGMSARGYANLFKKPAIVEVFEKYPAK